MGHPRTRLLSLGIFETPDNLNVNSDKTVIAMKMGPGQSVVGATLVVALSRQECTFIPLCVLRRFVMSIYPLSLDGRGLG